MSGKWNRSRKVSVKGKILNTHQFYPLCFMMVDRLKNAADFAKLSEEVDANYLTEIASDSPEYLLKLMQQVIGVFLSKLNIPSEEVDVFTEQIKERKMGELFAHFEAWDVQSGRN